MAIRVLPENLINQIAAGEVVERPASVVKELVENSIDSGATNIIIDVTDGGRSLISIIDDGCGMTKDDLAKCITRHATSKLPTDDLLNINFMGFRGEALPSIASVSDMTIDTYNGMDSNGWTIDCNTGNIKPSSWESGTRIRVCNLFGKTPARLKFLRSDRAELMSVVEVVKKLAMSRPDIGFVLNNKWRFKSGQELRARVINVIGEEVEDKLIEISEISNSTGALSLYGFISNPTFRRASSIDQYLFVNGRPVKDKVLVGALRAAYMDVMSSREFPVCALYLELSPTDVDVNVSPAKTEVHFLEPGRVRGFIIRVLREALSKPLIETGFANLGQTNNDFTMPQNYQTSFNHQTIVASPHKKNSTDYSELKQLSQNTIIEPSVVESKDDVFAESPLGRIIGQISNKYIITENKDGMVIIDQHAAHERIVYETLRCKEIKVQPLLTPLVINMRPEKIDAVLEIQQDLKDCGILIDRFGDGALAVFEKPADWDLDWAKLLSNIADEVASFGHSSAAQEKLHLKLANFACHHSVRAGQKLDFAQMQALVRNVENMERAGQCNHGRPVYKMISIAQLDSMFERI